MFSARRSSPEVPQKAGDSGGQAVPQKASATEWDCNSVGHLADDKQMPDMLDHHDNRDRAHQHNGRHIDDGQRESGKPISRLSQG